MLIGYANNDAPTLWQMERSRCGVSKSTYDFRSSSYRSLRFFSPLDYGGEAAIPRKNHLSYALKQNRDANPTEVSQGSQGDRKRGEEFLWGIRETSGWEGEIELIARKK